MLSAFPTLSLVLPQSGYSKFSYEVLLRANLNADLFAFDNAELTTRYLHAQCHSGGQFRRANVEELEAQWALKYFVSATVLCVSYCFI